PNEDMRPADYAEMREKYRPSHADYTYDAKYGVRDWRGGGGPGAPGAARRGARGAGPPETPARPPPRPGPAGGGDGGPRGAGVGRLVTECDAGKVTRAEGDGTPIRCPDLALAERMIAAVEAARKDGNSLGGVVGCAVRGCPPGWGEPVFDRLEADLAKAML